MFDPVTLTHNGKGHRVLRYLMDGPATRPELVEVAGVSGHKRRKFSWLMASLIGHGVVSHQPGFGYEITPDGEDVLTALDRGMDYTVGLEATPTVRIFARAA